MAKKPIRRTGASKSPFTVRTRRPLRRWKEKTAREKGIFFAGRKRVGTFFKTKSGKRMVLFPGGIFFLEALYGRKEVKRFQRGQFDSIVEDIESRLRKLPRWPLHPDSVVGTTFEAEYAKGKSIVLKDFSNVQAMEVSDPAFHESAHVIKSVDEFNNAIRHGFGGIPGFLGFGGNKRNYTVKRQVYLIATPEIFASQLIPKPTVLDVKAMAREGIVPDYLYEFPGSDFHMRALQRFFQEFEGYFAGAKKWDKWKNLARELNTQLEQFKKDNQWVGDPHSKKGINIAEGNILVDFDPRTHTWTFILVDRE